MSVSRNGLEAVGWRKSRRSMGNGECVEVGSAPGDVTVRDSMTPSGIVLRYPAGSWRTFLGQAKQGQFDVFRG
jgi:hypothetical protein